MRHGNPQPRPDIRAIFSRPRAVDARATDQAYAALFANYIFPTCQYGAYWHLGLQHAFESTANDPNPPKWILTVDSDSVFTDANLSGLISTADEYGERGLTCLAALQPKRETGEALCSLNDFSAITYPRDVDCAHFGLTLFKVEALRHVSRPFFFPLVDQERPDLAVWERWKRAGHRICVDDRCRIGHLNEKIGYYDKDYNYVELTFPEWRALEAKSDAVCRS